MTLAQWLDAVPGRTSRMAEHFRVSAAAISQWRINGVPVRKMIAVRKFTRNEVSVVEMVEERSS